jgi:hypothetical protein
MRRSTLIADQGTQAEVRKRSAARQRLLLCRAICNVHAIGGLRHWVAGSDRMIVMSALRRARTHRSRAGIRRRIDPKWKLRLP